MKKIPTPQDPGEAIKQCVALARELSKGEPIERIAGSSRGRIVDGVLVADKVLAQWANMPLAQRISSELGAPARVINDTAAAGLGEARFGAGKDSGICAYLTISTGVGGARTIDGTLDRMVYNAEIGRAYVNGEQLEDLISGTAVQKKFGIHPKDLESIDERNKLADILAVGLYNMVTHWSPDTIVLGGSMIVGVNPIPLERVAYSLSTLVRTTYPTSPKVVMAALGDNGGLWGGVALAHSPGSVQAHGDWV